MTCPHMMCKLCIGARERAADLVRHLAACKHESVNEQHALTVCTDCGAIRYPEASGWTLPGYAEDAKDLDRHLGMVDPPDDSHFADSLPKIPRLKKTRT